MAIKLVTLKKYATNEKLTNW